MNVKLRTFAAGAIGMVVAFGIVELVHGFYEPVPSVLVAVAQRIIELTPGDFATSAVEILGTADIPVLITFTVAGTLALAGLLAYLSRRSLIFPLAGVAVLAAVALAATLSEPSVSPVVTVLTVVAALGAGVAVAGFLLLASGLQIPEPTPEAEETPEPEDKPRSEGVRSREAHSAGGIAVPRRSFLLLGGGAAVAGLAAGGVGRLLGGEGARQSAGVGLPTSGVQILPAPAPEASLNVPGMPPLMTPNEDFYLIDTVLTSPRINVDTWTLNIMGEVDNPIELTYQDLISLPTREADVTLSCISNEVGGGLVSNARWTGVLLSDVLAEAGVSRDKITSASEQLVGRSADGWTSGFLTEIALDGREALVAFGMNGEELPLKHGYPVRLVVPGLYGYVSATKWLTEIELTDWDFDAYWIQRNWSKEGPIMTQSRFDTVSDGDRLSAATVQLGGVAWAPHRGIDRVEVSTDDGETWNDATLAAQLDMDTWRQYVHDWDASPGEYTLKVRATDGEGETQTENETSPHPSGATGYHTIEVRVA